MPSVNITPVECVRTIINLLYFSHPPKHTFLSGRAHLPYIDISSHPLELIFLSEKHTFLFGQAHLPYIDINSHPPKYAFLSGQAYVPYMFGVIEHVHYCISMSSIHVTHCDIFIKWSMTPNEWNWTVVQLQFSFSLRSIYDLFVT